jgi:AcrR family transcriptional regulator
MTARKTKEQQRLHIIESVDALLYQKGFNNMSFSDISEVTGVSKGNLYYYFKTKEDVLTSVIDHRIEAMKLMLSEWEQTLPTPIARLKRYVQITINESTNIIQYGCPMGSLNIELAKSQPLLQKISQRQFDVFKKWLKTQMKLVSPNINAEELTISLMARTQGVVVMSQVYKDKNLISRECEQIKQWLDEIY